MSKRLFHVILASIVGIIFVLGDAFLLCAQETSVQEFTLEEITVTAQKREEDQQKVPITMDTLSGEEFALEGKTDVDDILRSLANVTINTMSDGMRISIRGLTDDGNLGPTNFKEAGSLVGVNIDGVQNSMSSAGQNLFDVERVEVLYGPQSTLYGSNAPGGIVNVVTAAPKTDRYSASFGANYGSYNSINLQASLNVPVMQDKIALRLAATKTKQDNYVEGSTGTKNTSVRLKALWQLNDDLSITLTPSWSKVGSGGFMSGNVKPFKDQDGYYEDGTKVTDPWTKAEEATQQMGLGGDMGDQITKGLSADVNWKTSMGTFALVPSYNKSSSESVNTDMFTGLVMDTTQSSKQKAVELRVTNPEDFTSFQWIIGATYNEWDQGQSMNYRDPSAADNSFYRDSTKKALYANITYPFWFYDKLALTVGYRQSWDGTDSLSSPPPGSTGGGNVYRSTSFSKPDIKFGLNWDAAENLMFFGSFANSYRSGSPRAEDAEKLAAYTLGAKSRFFENKLQLNGSIYYYKYDNKEQKTERQYTYVSEEELGYDYDEDGTIETDETIYIENHGSGIIGSFKTTGADLSTTWIITTQDRLNLSASYLDGQWTKMVIPASELYPQIWPEVSLEGTQSANSPKLSLTAGYEHNFILGSYGALTATIDTQYKTAFELRFNPGQEDTSGYGHQEAYFLWNSGFTFNSSSGKWSLNGSVKNILNYAVKKSYMAQGGFMLMLGDPRTYQVGFNIKF